MGLLTADLRMLGNLVGHGGGRRLLFGSTIGLCLLALLSYWFANAILDRPQLLAAVDRQSGGDSLRGLLGYGLMACPLVATWLGLALAQRQLFEVKELSLWRQSPLPPWRLPLQALLRATFLSTVQATALAGPFVGTVLARSTAPAWAFPLVLLAIVGATAPLLAGLMAVQIVLVRFFAGRVLRIVFTVLAALASVGFSAWLMLTLFSPGQEQIQAIAAVAGNPARLPWTVDTGAALLAAAARGELDRRALFGLLGWLALTLLGFKVAAHWHAGAMERHLAAEPAIWRSRGSRWPVAVAAVVRRKEFAQLVQQPGALIGFLVFAVLVFALAKNQVLVGGLLGNDRLPREIVQTLVMLAQWFLAVLLVLYAHMGRLVTWDSGQWSLYVAAPASAFALLRGKLTAIFVYLLWPLVLVGASGAWLLPANGSALLAYGGLALGGTLAALGVLAIVGTTPMLVRPDDSGQVAPGGKGLFGAILLVLGFYVAVSPVVPAWLWLEEYALRHRLRAADVAPHVPWIVAAAIAYGAGIAAIGTLIGTANFRRLLAPRA